MATFKFKVGDKIVGNHSTRYAFTKLGWKGVVIRVDDCCFDAKGDGNIDHNGVFHGLEYDYFDLLPNKDKKEKPEKIVITHDGKTTTATKYCADGSKVTATARCAPEDEFDFNVGAKLAVERLVEQYEWEWRVVDRPAKVGDYIRLKTDGCFDWNRPGDILKVDQVGCGTAVRVLGANHHRETIDQNFYWTYSHLEYEVVEKVKKTETPKPPEYYNGNVVCIKNHYDISIPLLDFTIGKIYEVVDGVITSDTGYRSAHYYTLEKLCVGLGNTFIPVVE